VELECCDRWVIWSSCLRRCHRSGQLTKEARTKRLLLFCMINSGMLLDGVWTVCVEFCTNCHKGGIWCKSCCGTICEFIYTVIPKLALSSEVVDWHVHVRSESCCCQSSGSNFPLAMANHRHVPSVPLGTSMHDVCAAYESKTFNLSPQSRRKPPIIELKHRYEAMKGEVCCLLSFNGRSSLLARIHVKLHSSAAGSANKMSQSFTCMENTIQHHSYSAII